MANEDASEDRLTKNEFAELIQHLSVQEILAIEYRIGNSWAKLFSRKNVSTHIFFCNLCVLETSSFKNLLAHIDGRKHKLQMERVKQLYHPDYTYPKNDKKDDVEKSVTEISDDDTVSSKNKCALEKSDQSPVVDDEREKSLSIGRKKTANNSIKVDGENKIDVCVGETLADSGKQVGTTKGESFNEKKEKENTTLCVTRNSKCEVKNAEVVGQKQVLNLKPTLKSNAKVNKVIAEKRPFDNNIEEDTDFKKKKIVINPAAALSLKEKFIKTEIDKDEENNKKPQYQTDKIIIPTVHQKRKPNEQALPSSLISQKQSLGPPKFSVKSYSSNPTENDVYGVLGVEYVIKILKSRNDVSPRYECGLCELVFDGFAMQRHLEAYSHRLKFCEKHFPTAIRQYRQYMQNVPEPEIFKVMAPVLAKLAVAIEQHHGRNLPYECFERDFSLNRHEILAKAFSCRHASEQYGPTFTQVVGSKEIDELINNRQNYMPPSFSRTAIFDTKPGSVKSKPVNRHQNYRNEDRDFNLRDRLHHGVRENAQSVASTHKSYMSSSLHQDMYLHNAYKPADNVVQHVDDDTYNSMVDDFLKETLTGSCRNNALRHNAKRSVSPDLNLGSGKRKSLSPLRQNDIWQAYRHMVDQELYSLDERFKEYRKDPETHPSYNDEWQKFWKRRKDELVSAGLDHRKYNYQPEWVRFVKIRIEELYSQDVENLKIKSRERLCLPMSNDNIRDVKYHVQSQKISPSNELITDCNAGQTNRLLNPPTSVHSLNNNTPQVVSVLRLMTALEDSLGSLGPKIIDLLSKALQTEKMNPLYVNAVILNADNCSLIETAKEKFKGLVITGLFEGSKKRVLRQVVNDAEALLQYAYKFKQQLALQRSSVESAINRTENNSLPLEHISNKVLSTFKTQNNQNIGGNSLTRVDKKELASKLAASLVAQGKTDFDPQQLQQLITVYKLIEKKKRENVGSDVSHKESTSTSRKTLSDTLSELLKSSSSSAYTTSHSTNISNTAFSAAAVTSQTPSGTHSSLAVPTIFGNNGSSNPFTSVLQNSSDTYGNTTANSMANTFGASGGGGNQLAQRSNYGMNYTNNLQPNQQYANINNMYNNQYQHNRMVQNWGWNSNMEANRNYNLSRPNNNNNNFNQTSNWQNF